LIDRVYYPAVLIIITHIKNLRVKLGDAIWIETVRGFGYRFRGRNSENK
jgi:DNA-binding response OmpR family regulator